MSTAQLKETLHQHIEDADESLLKALYAFMQAYSIEGENLVIPQEILAAIKLPSEELRIEIAVYLYDKEKLSMGQAKRLAGLDQLAFQKELAKRDVYIHFSMKELEDDLETLRNL
ncbi:MAG: UPF0175 family protein [Phaeodactylibacter sp.]|nr:UPF0175 family protein [Phaeodactylibacter sp.]MCB9302331.1 UPF0175 family protein [Lewinellaceae bacterium]